jgi:acetyl-CoA C-acetyltransferase
MRSDDLATQMVTAALAEVPTLDPNEIDDLLLGCGLPGGMQGFNMARVVAVRAGLDGVGGATVTRYCASSVQTTRMAFHSIRAGEGDVFISAGVESVSGYAAGNSDRPAADCAEHVADWRNPDFAGARERSLARAAGGAPAWTDPREAEDLPDVYIAMGQTAENVAQIRGVSRADQDEFGCRSQNLAEASLANGFWAREVTPVTLADGTTVTVDDGIRAGVTVAAMAGLKPVFRPDGTVTAGNCCPLNDGAAALVVMSDSKAREMGVPSLARIVSTGVCGLSPEIMGLGPVEATRRALSAAGMTMADIDLVEINEAFAAQVLASARELEIPMEKLNVNGGAIAIGHPFGMTGARITTTMLNSLRSHDKTFGLVTMCVGGGQGMAMIIERLK